MPKLFSKIKHENGSREIFVLGRKIYRYVNFAQFANFMEYKINTQAALINAAQHANATNYDIVRGGGAAFTPLNSC